MNIEQLDKLLIEKGFDKEKLDTGYNYTKNVGHIGLTCYIEPNIEVAFITVYHWDDNEVKGTYNIALKDLKLRDGLISVFFENTLKNMPEHIGSTINTHREVKNVIKDIFGVI